MTTSLVDTLLWTEVDGAAGKEMVVLAVVPLVWCVWKIVVGALHGGVVHSFTGQTDN